MRTSEPIADPHLLRQLNKRACSLYSGDPSVCNPVRLMRLPGTISWPWKPGRAVPELTTLEFPEGVPAEGYPVELLQWTLPEPEREPTSPGTVGKQGEIPSVNELVRQAQANGTRWHDAVLRLTAHWVGRHFSDEEIRIWAPELRCEGWTIERTEDEMQVMIDGARQKWAIPDRDHPAITGIERAQMAFEPLPATAAEQTISIIKPMTTAELLQKEIPKRKLLLDPWLPERGAAMLHAWRGVGKTYLALSVSYAIASGGSVLCWRADEPSRVLHIDGEMPLSALQERLAGIIRASQTKLPAEDYLQFLAADAFPAGLPDLSSAEGRQLVEDLAKEMNAVLVVIDNLSSLVGGRENESQDYRPLQGLMLSLRRQGISVLILHHDGKGGQQRGTSAREDVLDTVIALRRPQNYTSSEGARFEVHFEKARGFYGAEAASFEAKLEFDAAADAYRWSHNGIQRAEQTLAFEMFGKGSKPKEVIDALAITKSTAYRWYKEWRDNEDGKTCGFSQFPPPGSQEMGIATVPSS